MTYLVLFCMACVAWFTYFSPTLEMSEKRAAQVIRMIAAVVLGGSLGFGLGRALMEVLLK